MHTGDISCITHSLVPRVYAPAPRGIRFLHGLASLILNTTLLPKVSARVVCVSCVRRPEDSPRSSWCTVCWAQFNSSKKAAMRCWETRSQVRHEFILLRKPGRWATVEICKGSWGEGVGLASGESTWGSGEPASDSVEHPNSSTYAYAAALHSTA
jgi:hypothetical protein